MNSRRVCLRSFGADYGERVSASSALEPSTNAGRVVGLEQLRTLANGGAGVTIAVIDGPVDLDHPVFEGADLRMASGATRWPARPGNRLAEHGTMVASILFGQPGSAVEGICPRASGVVVPVYDISTGRAPQLEIARAIELAIDEGANIINFSGGQYSDTGEADQWLAAAVRRCAEAGVLLVAAAGNDGCECLHVPAAASTALAVGAVDDTGMPMDFSNYGDGYTCNGITAPGEDILGAVPGGETARMSGTSFATPLVSGAAALMMAVRPGVGAVNVRDFLLQGAAPCGSNTPEVCRRLLVGRLDIEGAMKVMSEAPAIETSEATPSCGCGGSANHSHAGEPALVGAAPSSVSSFASGEAGVAPSMADAPDAEGLVYALGNISYDFGTEARRDSFKQLMPPVEIDGNVVPPNPYDARQLVAYLGSHPYEGRALIWTLNIELTPIYALEPTGASGAAGVRGAVVLDLVVGGAAGQVGDGEPRADLDPLHRLHAHAGGGQTRVELPVEVDIGAEPRRQAVDDDLDDAAQRVAVGDRRVDACDHRSGRRRVGAPHRVGVDAVEVAGAGLWRAVGDADAADGDDVRQDGDADLGEQA